MRRPPGCENGLGMDLEDHTASQPILKACDPILSDAQLLFIRERRRVAIDRRAKKQWAQLSSSFALGLSSPLKPSAFWASDFL